MAEGRPHRSPTGGSAPGPGWPDRLLQSDESDRGQDVNDLPLQERLLIAKLKKLRHRSLNGTHRDFRRLTVYLINNPAPTAASFNWPVGSPLSNEIDSALAEVKRFSRYAKRPVKANKQASAEQADRLWAHVLTAVDQLIDAGERLNGSPIKPSR